MHSSNTNLIMGKKTFSLAIMLAATSALVATGQTSYEASQKLRGATSECSYWERAVVHIECTTSPKDPRFLADATGSILLDADGKVLVVEEPVRSWRYQGTAIFVRHGDRRFLVTARHVLLDTLTGRKDSAFAVGLAKIFEPRTEEESDRYERSYIDSIKYQKHQEIAEAIFPYIFRVPHLDETRRFDPYLVDLRGGPHGLTSYTFSKPDTDLAVISLDLRYKVFADQLEALGYKPISSRLFADGPTKDGLEVLSVGYPYAISTYKRLFITSEDSTLHSPNLSHPACVFGRIALSSDKLRYFFCDMRTYSGSSGSPVIVNGKIIGIVVATPAVNRERVLFAKTIKAKFVNHLLEEQTLKDIAAEKESRKAQSRKTQ